MSKKLKNPNNNNTNEIDFYKSLIDKALLSRRTSQEDEALLQSKPNAKTKKVR